MIIDDNWWWSLADVLQALKGKDTRQAAQQCIAAPLLQAQLCQWLVCTKGLLPHYVGGLSWDLSLPYDCHSIPGITKWSGSHLVEGWNGWAEGARAPAFARRVSSIRIYWWPRSPNCSTAFEGLKAENLTQLHRWRFFRSVVLHFDKVLSFSFANQSWDHFLDPCGRFFCPHLAHPLDGQIQAVGRWIFCTSGTAAFAADCLLQAHSTPLPRLFLVELTQHPGGGYVLTWFDQSKILHEFMKHQRFTL